MSRVEEPVVAELTPAQAEAAYRRSVFENNFDQTVCDAAYRTAAEWQEQRGNYERLLAAVETLRTTVPQLEAEADRLEAEAKRPVMVVTDATTLGQIRDAVKAIAPRLPVATASDMLRSIVYLQQQEPLQRQIAARAARDHVQDVRQKFERVLHCGTYVPVDPRIDNLKNEIKQTENQIEARRYSLTAAERIPAARARLAAAKAVPMAYGSAERVRRDELRWATDDLARLISESKNKKQLTKDDAADVAALVELRNQLATAEAAQQAATLDPQNMAWPE